MKIPRFYCVNFINCQNNLPKYTPKDCKEQCHNCMDIIIDYHQTKNLKKQTQTPKTNIQK